MLPRTVALGLALVAFSAIACGDGSASDGPDGAAPPGNSIADAGDTRIPANDASAPADSAADTGSGDAASPTAFVHPGILVNRGMLDFVKAKIAVGAEPWKSALAAASSDDLGDANYQPHPRADVNCGPSSNPDNGCTDEKNDVAAAYTHALLWVYTGDSKHSAAAIRIMDAWSGTLQKHSGDNEPLQSAWAAEVFPRAGEIVRYTGAGWPDDKVARFSKMLTDVYLPEVKDGSTRIGNWDTSMIEAAINIAVFLDDRDAFQKAIGMWRKRTPAYIYMTTDGPMPVQPPNDPRSDSSLMAYWFNPTKLTDGLTQESCRDLPNSGTQGFGHAQYGVAGIINAAETARIQGVDLFVSEQARMVAMLELHAKYLNGASTSGMCQTNIASVAADPTWEIGYNAYANVLGQSLPQTKKLVVANRPSGATHHMVWETLTHGDIGNAGL